VGTVGVSVADAKSEMRLLSHGTISSAKAAVNARPMAITAIRCAGVSVSILIVFARGSWYNTERIPVGI
jgi:hypothetical protein